jgi:hypothetical protein
MSREIDTSGGTITKDEVLYLAQREQIPAANLQRREALEDLDEESIRKALAGEVDLDEWEPEAAQEPGPGDYDEKPDEDTEGDDEEE